LEDADYLSREIGILINNLQQYKDAIDNDDAETLKALLAEGDRRKREIEGR
jgi:prephenate dehydrogenase